MYFVESVITGDIARNNPEIVNRYRNPHLSPNFKGYREDAVIFGDHERSKIFHPPILFDRELIQKLSLNIHFDTINKRGRRQSDLERISSHTRTARELTENDVKIILQEGIRKWP